VSEFLFWVFAVDEGFREVLRGLQSPSGKTYEDLRDASADGQHVLTARWARNKITHCLARPMEDNAGRLGEAELDSFNLRPDLTWLDSKSAVADSLSSESMNAGRPEYDQHFAGRSIFPTLGPCFRWSSEVRYVHSDPGYAENWFRHQP